MRKKNAKSYKKMFEMARFRLSTDWIMAANTIPIPDATEKKKEKFKQKN